MAQYIFEAEAQKRSIAHVAISMGTLGLLSQEPPPEATQACEELDIHIEFHRSQPLSNAVLKHATHIFVMEEQHVEALKKIGVQGDRVQFLGVWDLEDPRPEIDDPVNQPIETFRHCRDRILRAVRHFLDTQAP